ncbi:ribosome hibernation-promoting factor, HPF/YfiA family [Acholeplasma hippikon]|uniref:Ribosome hibernation promoting factor n=1 Tax=Acholeplasma hippikon TaxID=264636 RepID=A0A449BJV7_9MOLU|nr:ribosome-associated translation inhibitor RaiA [Acholeplasma hippikon]VEU82734.1 Ribosome-associated factor Y [Acholeplasma hippikon]
MRYEITGKNGFQPTDAIRAYVEKKMVKVINFFDNNAVDYARIVLSAYKNFTKVEVTIPSPYIILRSEVKDPDMYAAIDKTVDKLSQQIRKHKTKVRKEMQKGGAKSIFTQEFDTEALEKEVKANNLVKSKKISIKPMTVDDAITAMELSGHDFFIFLDINTFDPRIVYRRDDGDYAVIDAAPEKNK